MRSSAVDKVSEIGRIGRVRVAVAVSNSSGGRYRPYRAHGGSRCGNEKLTAPGVSRRSPVQVLSRPDPAYLQSEQSGTSEKHKGAPQHGKPLWPQKHGGRLSLGSTWWRADLYGCSRSAWGGLQMGKCAFFCSQRVGINGAVGVRMRAGTRVGLHGPGRQDGLGLTGRAGRLPGPPRATRRARESGKSEAEIWRRCPMGEAAVRKQLTLQNPGGGA